MSKLFEEIENFLNESEKIGKPPLIVVLGPTATGKTALSIRIARRFNGEIISADSRQIYKYMDIATEKVTEAEKEGVPHHLVDVIEPNEEFTLADFKRAALKSINEIQRKKKIPILCGGTGLYINSIIDNYQIPQVAPQYGLRQELAAFYERYGAIALHKKLQECDPEAARNIHPNNVRYVIRALEINLGGNGRKEDRKGDQLFNVFSTGIDWPRERLYDRINKRVEDQVSRGLVNEVKTLLMRGYGEQLPAMTSLGYSEVISYIKGNTSLEEALEEMKKNTRNYAKRQMTWFRRHKDIKWITPEELVEMVTDAARVTDATAGEAK